MTDRTEALLAEMVELQRRVLAHQQEALEQQRLAIANQEKSIAIQAMVVERQRTALKKIWILIGIVLALMLGIPALNFVLRMMS